MRNKISKLITKIESPTRGLCSSLYKYFSSLKLKEVKVTLYKKIYPTLQLKIKHPVHYNDQNIQAIGNQIDILYMTHCISRFSQNV